MVIIFAFSKRYLWVQIVREIIRRILWKKQKGGEKWKEGEEDRPMAKSVRAHDGNSQVQEEKNRIVVFVFTAVQARDHRH